MLKNKTIFLKNCSKILCHGRLKIFHNRTPFAGEKTSNEIYQKYFNNTDSQNCLTAYQDQIFGQ